MPFVFAGKVRRAGRAGRGRAGGADAVIPKRVSEVRMIASERQATTRIKGKDGDDIADNRLHQRGPDRAARGNTKPDSARRESANTIRHGGGDCRSSRAELGGARRTKATKILA